MRIRLTLIPLAVAAALVAGCTNPTTAPPTDTAATPNGVADLSAQEILEKAQQSLANVDSFQVKGTMAQAGMGAQVDIVVNGDDAEGTIVTDGETIEVVKVGNDAYLKLPESLLALFTSGNPAAAALAAGKYLKVKSDDATFGELASFGNIREEILTQEADMTGVTKGEAKTINGTPAIGLNTPNGTLYVATQGEPYPLRLEGTEGAIDFTSFNSAPAVEAPPADQVLDVSVLIGGTGN